MTAAYDAPPENPAPEDTSMYGTVMVGRLRGTLEEMQRVNDEWLDLRVPGFVREETLLGDDGRTVISVVFFESREAYQRLASDPRQDEFWRTRMLPVLDGEPRWFDGTWQATLTPRTAQGTAPTR
jgi:hypothetical protein